MSVTILNGSALALPLPDDSVDLVVTSPPYFGLRSYTDQGNPMTHQVGAEATPDEYVDALIEATRECMRVLKNSGSLWVNLGDKYAGAGRGNNNSDKLNNTAEMMTRRLQNSNARQHLGLDMAPAKSLMGLPWRYALRCIDELGLILRAEVVWSKPNGLPESVRDRVRRSHEQWFHFTLSPNYYANVDEVREAYTGTPQRRGGTDHQVGEYVGRNKQTLRKQWDEPQSGSNPLGKLPGSVWTIATQPLRVPAELGVDHFAAFPMEWPRRIITGWSPPGICTACGEGRRATRTGAWHFREPGNVNAARALERAAALGLTADGVATKYGVSVHLSNKSDNANNVHPNARRLGEVLGGILYGRELISLVKRLPDGYACACPTPDAPTRPAVVLDPFGGTGTTALVADVLGRDAVHVDLSADYCRLAEWRTADPKERARVEKLHVPRLHSAAAAPGNPPERNTAMPSKMSDARLLTGYTRAKTERSRIDARVAKARHTLENIDELKVKAQNTIDNAESDKAELDAQLEHLRTIARNRGIDLEAATASTPTQDSEDGSEESLPAVEDTEDEVLYDEGEQPTVTPQPAVAGRY